MRVGSRRSIGPASAAHPVASAYASKGVQQALHLEIGQRELLLYVVPARDTVAVVHAWNVFGTQARGIDGLLLDALHREPLVPESAGTLLCGDSVACGLA